MHHKFESARTLDGTLVQGRISCSDCGLSVFLATAVFPGLLHFQTGGPVVAPADGDEILRELVQNLHIERVGLGKQGTDGKQGTAEVVVG